MGGLIVTFKGRPKGNNNQLADALYKQRLYYKNDIFPTSGPKPLDLWYEKPYYGKVDIYGNLIYPSETYLRALPGKNQFAMNFVVEAFNDFRDHISAAQFFNRAQIQELFGGFTASRSFSSVHQLYHQYFKTVVYDNFANQYLRAPSVSKTITNFSSYLNAFLGFCKSLKNEVLVTKTAFICSNNCPNGISGLFIDLLRMNHGDDAKKYTRIISNDAFDEYRNIAQKFGFLVNKNAPWQLVSNLASEKTKMYVDKVSGGNVRVDGNELFKMYYYRIGAMWDYETFVLNLYDGYRSYLMSSPYIRHVDNNAACVRYGTLRQTGVGANTTNTYTAKEPVAAPILQPDGSYGLPYVFRNAYEKAMLEAYFQVRVYESKTKMHKNAFKTHFKKAYNLFQHVGKEKALNYINDVTKQTRIYDSVPGASNPYQLKYLKPSTLKDLSPVEKDGTLLMAEMDTSGKTFTTTSGRTITGY